MMQRSFQYSIPASPSRTSHRYFTVCPPRSWPSSASREQKEKPQWQISCLRCSINRELPADTLEQTASLTVRSSFPQVIQRPIQSPCKEPCAIWSIAGYARLRWRSPLRRSINPVSWGVNLMPVYLPIFPPITWVPQSIRALSTTEIVSTSSLPITPSKR